MAVMKMPTYAGGGGNAKCEYLGTLPSNGIVDCGFKPKSVIAVCTYSGASTDTCIYNEDTSTTTYKQFFGATASLQNADRTMGDTGAYGFIEVGGSTAPNGFVFNPTIVSNITNFWYCAIG